MELLQQEWLLQQQRRNDMENHSLAIKLLALLCFLWLSRTAPSPYFLAASSLLFWLLDAIWKAEQARVTQRLLQLEQALRGEGAVTGMQFQSAWAQGRGGIVSLLGEYVRAGSKPTVALLYVLLILAAVARFIVQV